MAICTIYKPTLYHYKALKNLPKFGFLVWKYAIWQPCLWHCKVRAFDGLVFGAKITLFIFCPTFRSTLTSRRRDLAYEVIKLWKICPKSRATGWVCEKIAQNVAKTHFLTKLMQNLNSLKSSQNMWNTYTIFKEAKICGTLLQFSKNYPTWTITQWAKIRPIWSPCQRGRFYLALPVE
jgi:hypothetical protein